MTQFIADLEEWRSIEGFPGYEVSSEGRYRSWLHANKILKTPAVRRLKPNRKGYLMARMRVEVNCQRGFPIHHLVLKAFVGPRPIGFNGLHKDDDRKNNRVANLYWGTERQNAADRYRNGRGNNKLTELQVLDAVRRCEGGESQLSIAVKLGVSQVAISRIILGRTWTRITGRIYGATPSRRKARRNARKES